MRILVVSQMGTSSQTGITTYYLTLKKELEKQHHTVQIITPEECPYFIRRSISAISRVIKSLPSDFSKFLSVDVRDFYKLLFAVKRNVKLNHYDIIHSADIISGCVSNVVTRGTVQTVTTCHFNDTPLQETLLRYKLNRWNIKLLQRWYSYLFSKNSNYIFTSDYSYNKTKELLPAAANVRKIYNGITFQRRSCNSVKTSSTFTIWNVGTIEVRKNQLLLIKTANFLKQKNLPFKFYFYGDGSKKTEWMHYAKEIGVSDCIEFAGYRKDVFDETGKPDLYVHTALNENCSLTILEAFASNTPILALSTGGTPELFTTIEEGLLPADIQPEELASIIISYMDDSRRATLKKKQYAATSTTLNAENMTNQTLRFYNELLHKVNNG